MIEAASPLLLTAAQLATELNVSQRTLRRMDLSGEVPLPLKIGKSLRWRRAEIEAWIDAGAPPRRKWNVLRPPDENTRKRSEPPGQAARRNA